jgi:hypothetical protein
MKPGDEKPTAFWTEEDNAAFEAGRAGAPCPNENLEMYSFGMSHAGYDQCLCFYQPGRPNIVDLAHFDGPLAGRSAITNETLQQIRARYPGAVLIAFDVAKKEINKIQAENYRVGQPREIDEEKFMEALGVLPPLQWTREKGWESFKICEPECGMITTCYVRIGSRFFEVYGYVDTPAETLKQWCEKKP